MNQATSETFTRQIPAYLDGTLAEEERLRFEAHVGSDPAFAKLFRQKSAEHESLRQRVPDLAPDAATLEALESEAREVVANLFRDEAAPAKDRLTRWLKEFL